MNVAIFGGTFDPVHRGHLAVARAAARRYRLDRVYFVPADLPPHKTRYAIAPFCHRYAMLSLATAGKKRFAPSTMESNEGGRAKGAPNYSIDTVRRFRRHLGKRDRLFFLIGIDAFLEIATWRDPVSLLREAEFIVVSRPGYSLQGLVRALPASLRTSQTKRRSHAGDLEVGAVTIHVLATARERVSATEVRTAAARGKNLNKMVPPAVAEYIEKTHLYRSRRPVARAAAHAHLHHHGTGGE